MLILDVITLTLAGLLVGDELAIAAIVHPVLCRLPDPVHFAGANAFAKLLGRVMPFWYALVLVLTASLTLLDHHTTGSWPRLLVLSAGLWVLSIVYSVTFLVPINNRIVSWTEETRPTDWKSSRSRPGGTSFIAGAWCSSRSPSLFSQPVFWRAIAILEPHHVEC